MINFYLGSISNLGPDRNQEFFDSLTDDTFAHGIHKAKRDLVNNGNKVFQYLLSYEGEHSFSELYGIPPVGVCHGDDVQYLFSPNFISRDPLSDNDALVKELMTDLWTNFAKFGDPTPPGSKFSWIPVDPESEYYEFFEISGPETSGMVKSEELGKRMKLWDSIY